MKREDFVNITEEHRKICEEVINGKINCNDVACSKCMFYIENAKNNSKCFKNKYSDLMTLDNVYGVNKLFVESCKMFFNTFFNDKQNIEKEDVIKIESQEVFDSVAFRIVYQNEEVLKRGIFKDYKINVFSIDRIGYYDNCFYIRGSIKDSDSKVFVVTKKEFKDIENKVRLINEKYGIEKRWRAEKGGIYFFVDITIFVLEVTDYYFNQDERLYASGNYFKTRKEAEEVAEKFRKILEDRGK